MEKPPENPGKGGFWEKGQFETPPHIVVTGRAKNQLKKASLKRRSRARIGLTTKLARNVLLPKHQVGASGRAGVCPKCKRSSARPSSSGCQSGTICHPKINPFRPQQNCLASRTLQQSCSASRTLWPGTSSTSGSLHQKQASNTVMITSGCLDLHQATHSLMLTSRLL